MHTTSTTTTGTEEDPVLSADAIQQVLEAQLGTGDWQGVGLLLSATSTSTTSTTSYIPFVLQVLETHPNACLGGDVWELSGPNGGKQPTIRVCGGRSRLFARVLAHSIAVGLSRQPTQNLSC
jgi:hypothetical protein